MKRMQRLVNIFQKILFKTINNCEFEDNNFFLYYWEACNSYKDLEKDKKKDLEYNEDF